MNKLFSLGFLALSAALLSPLAATAATSVPDSGKLTFDVIRKSKDIGDFRIAFRQSGGNLTVDLKTDVAVKLPLIGIKAYVFEQTSRETWANGKMTGLASRTNDNGTDHNIHLGAQALQPASLWNEATIRTGRLVNTVDGQAMKVRVRKLGAESVTTGHGKIKADHYRIEGDLARDVWFTSAGTLAKVAFTGDDGSRIEYRLR